MICHVSSMKVSFCYLFILSAYLFCLVIASPLTALQERHSQLFPHERYYIPGIRSVRGYIVFAFSVCLYVCKLFFVSKISQELLNLEFQNLVQSLGMSSCIVYFRINNLWLINVFIYPFFSLSDKFFHHISSVCIRVRDFKFYMHIQNDRFLRNYFT